MTVDSGRLWQDRSQHFEAFFGLETDPIWSHDSDITGKTSSIWSGLTFLCHIFGWIQIVVNFAPKFIDDYIPILRGQPFPLFIAPWLMLNPPRIPIPPPSIRRLRQQRSASHVKGFGERAHPWENAAFLIINFKGFSVWYGRASNFVNRLYELSD